MKKILEADVPADYCQEIYVTGANPDTMRSRHCECTDITDYVRALENEVDEHQWIPISERLPPNKPKMVLYAKRYGGIDAGCGDWLYCNPWECAHWMPLPAPPQHQEQD